MRRARWALGVVAVTAVFGWSGAPARAASPKVQVVAAEDFWGSIARELGGDHADVTSLISDPGTEPHHYEAKPSDGAAVAQAKVAVVNGLGYDGWMSDLLAANPSSTRLVVNVGDVVGAEEGQNPHQWYSPPSVQAVVDAIADALKQADPTNAAYFDARRQAYRTERLKRYDDLRTHIEQQYGGVPVGASESIFAPLAQDLGLKLITPGSFIEAISEGSEPTARDKATVDRQITERQIKVFVYNAQNSTPDVEALVGKAKKAGIPVATVTETLVPEGATFHDWQTDQLQRLADALAQSADSAAVPVNADQALADSPAPASGDPSRWPVLAAVCVFLLGGLGLAAGVARRRSRPPLQA